MYKEHAVDTLTTAVLDILQPKFEQYVKDVQEDLALLPEINKEITNIEKYEDILNDNFEVYDKDSAFLGGYWYTYDRELEIFHYQDSKFQSAKQKVLNDHHLNTNWNTLEKLENRIAAIISTIEETSFDKVVEIVEAKLNWSDFLN